MKKFSESPLMLQEDIAYTIGTRARAIGLRAVRPWDNVQQAIERSGESSSHLVDLLRQTVPWLDEERSRDADWAFVLDAEMIVIQTRLNEATAKQIKRRGYPYSQVF